MGISLDQYRASVGLFITCSHNDITIPSGIFYKSQNKQDWSKFNSWFFTKKEWSRVLLCGHHRLNFNVNYLNVIIPTLLTILLLSLCMDVHPNPGPNWSDLTICHSNIRSLRNFNEKLDHIRCDLAESFDIVTLSETWLDDSIHSNKLHLSGFQSVFRKDRHDNQGYGGVLAWVSMRIAAKRRLDLELEGLEAMWLEIRCHNNKFLLCVLYRPPNSPAAFWDRLQESIDLAYETNIRNLLITGDINADPHTPNGQKLKQFTDGNLLNIHINEPTRITPTSATIVDQFISNIPGFIKTQGLNPQHLIMITVLLELTFYLGPRN